ncbi:MAG TPA: hypothetical protein DEB52_16975 [Hyphomonas sp.]|jgi:hypothetical protein|nr:hypothetical protein [Hyphomonas sp.]HBT37628.1 hypothetical protein [Hyphomonas sp.]|tara:strand:- start:2386 stop:2589 length:204 start_codon:yes stop_codon:yes gene_type:complete
MSYVQFSKLLSSLSIEASSAARDAIEVLEIDEAGTPSSADVTAPPPVDMDRTEFAGNKEYATNRMLG